MKAVLERPLVKRLVTFLGLALFLALVTGPDGTQDKPWAGFQHSWLAGRVIGWIIAAVVLAFVVEAASTRREALQATRTRVRAQTTGLYADKRVKIALLVALAALLLWYPTTLSTYWVTILVSQIAIYVLLAMGLNVVVGFAGLLDLGFIAFYAIGAYTTAYFTHKLHDSNLHFEKPPITLSPFWILPIAVVIAMVAGLLLGAPTLRLRGDYLAIVTLGFGEIVRIVAVNNDKDGGPNGVFGVPHPALNLGFFHYRWSFGQLPYYYLLLFVIVVVYFLLRRLEDSRVGRAWTAIREDEVAAEANGIPTLKLKLMAFAIGASTSGFAGVLYASNIGSFSPDNFVFLQSLLVLVMVIFGGMGSIPGVMVGALILGWLPNALKDYVKPTDRYIYYGILLIAMMIFRPQGIIPSKRRAREIALLEQPEATVESLSAAGTSDVLDPGSGGVA